MTQMGIQIHSSSEYRTAVKIVHDGIIGKIVQPILLVIKDGEMPIFALNEKILCPKVLIGMLG